MINFQKTPESVTPMQIAVPEKKGARPMIRITLKLTGKKEGRMVIGGNRPSAEAVVRASAVGRASARIRNRLKRPTFKNKKRWVIQLCWEARL